jgi:hypothetical protein
VDLDALLLGGGDELAWRDFMIALAYFYNFEDVAFRRLGDTLQGMALSADLSRTEFASGMPRDV